MAASATADQAKISALDIEYQAAVKRGDVATMDRILHPDFILVRGDGRTVSRDEILDGARSGDYVYEQQDELPGTQTVRLWGKDTAVVTALLWIKGKHQGPAVSIGGSGSATPMCAPPPAGATPSPRFRCRCPRTRQRIEHDRADRKLAVRPTGIRERPVYHCPLDAAAPCGTPENRSGAAANPFVEELPCASSDVRSGPRRSSNMLCFVIAAAIRRRLALVGPDRGRTSCGCQALSL